MREKLIELFEGSLRYAGDVCGETGDCSKCQYDKYGSNCGYAIRADYLIANGVTIAKWIPVTERLPEEWTNVLVYSGGNYDVLMYRPNRRETLCFMYQDECGYWKEKHSPSVTHWMPLPEPPKGE
jgi:hypothetical protein